MKWLEAKKAAEKASKKGAPPVESLSGSMTYQEAKAWGEAKGLAAKMDRAPYEDKALHEAPDTEDKGEEWPLKMSPKRYLALHPEGQWADLAATLVADEAEDDAEPTEAKTD